MRKEVWVCARCGAENENSVSNGWAEIKVMSQGFKVKQSDRAGASIAEEICPACTQGLAAWWAEAKGRKAGPRDGPDYLERVGG
jgi:hypothetical protein